MKLVLLSDTHEYEHRVELPLGDVLIHAGDFTMLGDLDKVAKFGVWFRSQPHKHKILIAGNHDISLEKSPAAAHLALGTVWGEFVYLQDSGTEIDGVKFWGSPWTPRFGFGWAFNADPWKMEEVCAMIPDDTNVLITHGPPFDMLDETEGRELAGCPKLAKRLGQLQPLVHVFGHIHEAMGQETKHGTRFVNASFVDAMYHPTNKPFVVEI
jgi:predicted phosphodiesterase